ncbi:hypothetical protein [Actinotalea subterranea]|uniref:hypothetical protein n=1 Tax=Actinotalea subterranea TaxID=2607497 RepID=UPI0011EE0458|nr:hypothetical protein [Actinotalea subterranea]
MASKTRTWAVGTALLAVVILVGTWFLAAAPKLKEAGETRVAVDDALARQDMLRVQLETLRTQFEELDTYKAELAAIQGQIPAVADLTGYIRQLQAAAETTGVTIVGVTPGTPTALVPVTAVVAVEPESVADAPAEDADAADDAGATDGTATAPAAPTSRLVSVPVSIQVMGTYANTTAFLETVQTGNQRLYLVSAINATTLDDAEASGGKPASARGDLDLTIDGFIYVLPEDPTAVVAPTDEPTEPTETPLPSSDRNPFAPVG